MATALAYLRAKFETVDSYGPRQVAVFYEAITREERERHSRRGYELVRGFWRSLNKRTGNSSGGERSWVPVLDGGCFSGSVAEGQVVGTSL